MKGGREREGGVAIAADAAVTAAMEGTTTSFSTLHKSAELARPLLNGQASLGTRLCYCGRLGEASGGNSPALDRPCRDMRSSKA